MANYDLLSNTNIYKNTYHELICWVKELSRLIEVYKVCDTRHTEMQYFRSVTKLYSEQITRLQKRIMELEFDLQRYSIIMVEDKQEQVMDKYSVPEADIVSNEEFQKLRVKRGGGGGGKDVDWLSGMEWGTQIYCRMRVGQREPWMLVKFLFAGIRQKTALLVPMMGAEDVVADDRQWIPVDPIKFCKTWELYDYFPPVPLEKDNE